MTANDLQIGSVIQTPTNIITITQVGNTYIWARDNNNQNIVSLKKEVKEFFDKGTWKLIPAAPDILTQLREALGWETGSIEDVIKILIETKNLFDVEATMGIFEYVRFSGDRRVAYKKLIQLMLSLNTNNKQQIIRECQQIKLPQEIKINSDICHKCLE